MSARLIKPQDGKQEAFLSSSADIVIYGGAAGAGKTWGLVVEPLRHIHTGDFNAVIFRRTSPQITNPGGLYDESRRWYPLFGGKDSQPNSGITWKFPSGALVRFAHLQHDKTVYDWQGSQIALLAFDELTHFSEEQFFYLFSRNRSTCGVRPYIRATCNADAGSWVAQFIAWWIDQETGYPIPERAGVIRWFVRVQEQIVWGDGPEALKAQYPYTMPKSLTFIPAKLEDNQILMRDNPEYVGNLMAMPLVERERLLNGNWKILPSGGKVFNSGWFEIVPRESIPTEGAIECRFWDFAATEKKLKGDDPDFTAGVKIRRVGDQFYVMDCIAVQAGPAEVTKLLLSTSLRDREQANQRGMRYKVRWEKEPGGAGKRENRSWVALLKGFDARGVAPEGDKITRASALSTQSEQGFVALAVGEWNEGWLIHMHHQPDWGHDDIMDASAGAFTALADDSHAAKTGSITRRRAGT